MNTANKIIIYDDSCPLCAAYTSAFVNAGLLAAEGRKNFTTIDTGIFKFIDQSKCNYEIPLIDTDTKQVWYGIDALLEILGAKLPLIKKTGNIRPVKWLLKKLYRLISYNRKVILAIAPEKDHYDCSPAFNMRYRLTFLLIFFVFNSLMLWPYYQVIFTSSFIEQKTFGQLQLAHCVLAALNVSSAVTLSRRQILEYLGQVNMLALTSILLIFPLYIFINATGCNNSWVNNSYLFVMTLFIIREYHRRMKYAHIFYEHKKIVGINIAGVAAFAFYLMY